MIIRFDLNTAVPESIGEKHTDRSGLMVRKLVSLVKLQLSSEVGSHCLLLTSVFVPQLSYV